jgi:hypothetical protein
MRCTREKSHTCIRKDQGSETGERSQDPTVARMRKKQGNASNYDLLNQCNAVNKPGYDVNSPFEKTNLRFTSNLARTHSRVHVLCPDFVY